MLKYALIVVAAHGGQADSQIVMRGYETLPECQAAAAHQQAVYNTDPAIRLLRWRADPQMPSGRFVCVPDHGEKDGALLRSVK